MYTVDKHQVEPYDFLFYFSPTIPYDYPKEKVPPNLCELPLLKVYKCFLDYTKNADELKRAKHCRMYSAEFNNCKKRRDMQIFKDIRSWEEERVKNLNKDLRSVYVNALKQELGELRNDFEKVQATDENANKRWRINADILQTQWRIRYSEELVTNLNSE